MGQAVKSNKIHINPEDVVRVEVGDMEIVLPFCDRPTVSNMTVDLETAKLLAGKDLSGRPFCTICIAKSGVDFRKQRLPFGKRTAHM